MAVICLLIIYHLVRDCMSPLDGNAQNTMIRGHSWLFTTEKNNKTTEYILNPTSFKLSFRTVSASSSAASPEAEEE